MTFSQLLTAIVSIGTLQALVSIWLKGRLEASLKHEYDRKLEDLKFEIRQREQAAMIAELLAEWVSKPMDTKHLNRLTWEASIWLPERIARDLCATLNHQPASKSYKDLIVEVRKILKGDQDGLTADQVIDFPATYPRIDPSYRTP
jgi:hypothetical protein